VLRIGEGGLVTTNDDEVAAEIRSKINFGICDGIMEYADSTNSKIDEFRCAIGLESFECVDDHIKNRSHIAKMYREGLVNLKHIEQSDENNCITNQLYPVLFDDKNKRDDAIILMRQHEIGCKVYYTPFNSKVMEGYDQTFVQNTADVYNRILCIPMWSIMDNADVCKVIECLKSI
jgi:dTDP-4-amino-4,6-dideoxygalactose transaminase